MTEIADIGFRVATGDLEKGVTGLNKLAAAAAGVDTATMKMAKLSEAAGISVARAAKVAADAEYKKAQAVRANLIASGNASREELKAAKNAELAANAKLKQARAAEANTAKLNAESEALRKNNALQMASTRPTTKISAVVSQGTLTAAPIARDQMPNRFNTANIAAQFQDIGVTAAMGMNPMTIALQQGTQLSAIMNSMESPLKGIAQAFRSIFNATSLLSIGFVGLIAALIQFVDWTKFGQTALNGLAAAAEAAIPVILGLGTILAIIYAPSIYAGIVSVTVAIYGMAKAAIVAGASMVSAWAAAAAPLTLLLAAVAALGLAFQAFGFDVIGTIKKVANSIIGFFVGAFNAVKATWKMLPAAMGDIVITMANIVLGKIEAMINGSVQLFNSFISKIPERFRPDGAMIEWKAKVKIENPFAGMANKVDKMAEAEFSKAQKDYVGSAGKWIGDKLRGAASGIGAAAAGKDAKGGKGSAAEVKDPWEELVKDAERKISVLKAEQQAIGMTEEAAAKLRYETELLNDAQQKGIVLDEAKRNKLSELATGMARTEAETKRLKTAYDFLRDTGKGFISDLRSGLQEGKSLWESFGNAVKGVIDKILDKILESQVDKLMGALLPSGGSLGGSTTGSILSSVAGFLGFAKGGTFNNGLVPFAKGGAFTNSIVNRATPFAFADGGAFGVMGEAGPEAVMPLHRGPDGSLGVRANVSNASNDNAAPQQNVTYVINAPGASKADLESVRQTIMAYAGPGVVEQRVMNAKIRGANT